MTHVLIWLLCYPLVAAADTFLRVRVTEMDVGVHNAAHTGVYIAGTFIMLVMHYV